MSRVLFCVSALIIVTAGCTPPKTEPAPPPTGQEVTIKCGDLMKEYQTNALAADGKYKGKRINVTGKVGSIRKAPLYGYVLDLLPEEGGEFTLAGIQCILGHEPSPEAAALKEGDMVKVTGNFDGPVVGQLKMNKCLVAK
jgi:hypothetical protein